MKTTFRTLSVLVILSLITASYSGCNLLPPERGIGVAMGLICLIWAIPSKILYNNGKVK